LLKSEHAASPSPQRAADLAAETEEEYKSRRIHNLRKLLADLEDQRGKIEQELISLSTGEDKPRAQQLNQALDHNQQLRLQYLAELRGFLSGISPSAPDPDAERRPHVVFVSSTYTDLVKYRAGVKDAVARCDMFFRGMEHFGAHGDGTPPAVIREQVQKADVYLGIIGVRYGSIDPATGLSMTELEYRTAETCKKPMLLYVIHEETRVSVADIEADPEAVGKLKAFRQHVLDRHVCYKFRSVEDLAGQAYSDLLKLKDAPSNAVVHFSSINRITPTAQLG
jgi:hypothetical protein